MEIKKILILSLSVAALIGVISLSDLLDIDKRQEPTNLSVSSIEADLSGINSFNEISECEAGKGILRKPNSSTGPQIITFTDKVIGVNNGDSRSGWNRENSIYFRKPPTQEECEKGEFKTTYNESDLQFSNFRSLNDFDITLENEGSVICRPETGIVWSIGQNTDLMIFEEQVIGFESSGQTVFFKEPPTAHECAEKRYLTKDKQKNISGDKILDTFQGTQERKFFARPSACEEWFEYEGVSNLNCNYTRSGLEDVSLVTDPGNFITAPRTEDEFEVDILSQELGDSWDISLLPGGNALITNHDGKINLYKEGEVKNIDSVDAVLQSEIAGLMGAAIDPEFEQNNHVYLYYTYDFGEKETPGPAKTVKSRISRFKYENEKLKEEKVLLEDIPAHNFHTGGRLEFSPDGKLFATVGEGGAVFKDEFSSQSKDQLRGKIIRLNKDGSIPSDNPYSDSYVYSRGHRNPQGLDWHPDTGDLYSTEHGPWRHDELNKIEPGSNYGWPRFKCGKSHNEDIEQQGEVKNPMLCFENWSIAPSGITFVDDPESPWYGDLFVAGLRGNHLHRFEISDEEINHQEVFYVPEKVYGSPRIRDVEYFEGSLWVLGDRGWLVNLEPKNN